MPIEDYISILYYRSQYELVRYELASFLVPSPSRTLHTYSPRTRLPVHQHLNGPKKFPASHAWICWSKIEILLLQYSPTCYHNPIFDRYNIIYFQFSYRENIYIYIDLYRKFTWEIHMKVKIRKLRDQDCPGWRWNSTGWRFWHARAS